MVHININQNNFSSGEISDEYLGRQDLNLYNSGARALQNFDILPSGILQKRPGTKPLKSLENQHARLKKFIAPNKKAYLLIFEDQSLEIWDPETDMLAARLTQMEIWRRARGRIFLTEKETLPWRQSFIADLHFFQCPEFLLICHPQLVPMKLSADMSLPEASRFKVERWPGKSAQDHSDILPFQPHGGTANRLTLSQERYNGRIYLQAGTPRHAQFLAGVGSFIKMQNGTVLYCRETGTINNQEVMYCELVSGPNSFEATESWEICPFSLAAGMPRFSCLHQGRLIFAGNMMSPAGLWMSHIGDYYNFKLGEQDDEAIQVTLEGGNASIIRHIVSNRHLQIFSDTGEWIIDNDVITPGNIAARLRTRVGAHPSRRLQPVSVNDLTVFCDSERGEMYEYVYTEIEAAYLASNLNSFARTNEIPLCMSYDSINRRIYSAMPNGDMRVLALYRQEKIVGWSSYRSAGGLFKEVESVDGQIYALVGRTLQEYTEDVNEEKPRVFFLEKFMPDITVDHYFEVKKQSDTGEASSEYHIHPLFAGQDLIRFNNGEPVTDPIITSGRVQMFVGRIPRGRKTLQAVAYSPVRTYWGIAVPFPPPRLHMGIVIEARVESMPLVLPIDRPNRRYRLLEALFLVKNSETFSVGIGSRNVHFFKDDAYDENLLRRLKITEQGHKKAKIKSLGWHDSQVQVPWIFIHKVPETVVLLGVEMRLSVH